MTYSKSARLILSLSAGRIRKTSSIGSFVSQRVPVFIELPSVDLAVVTIGCRSGEERVNDDILH